MEEVAEHSPPSVLAQVLRMVRHHLAQATDGIRQVVARTGDGGGNSRQRSFGESPRL